VKKESPQGENGKQALREGRAAQKTFKKKKTRIPSKGNHFQREEGLGLKEKEKKMLCRTLRRLALQKYIYFRNAACW
jgi:hypothetical protein